MTSEQRRLHYLQSMGIDGYYPRYQLSGAAVPVACEHIFDEDFLFLAGSVVLNKSSSDLIEGFDLNEKQQRDASLSQLEHECKPAKLNQRTNSSEDITQDLVVAKTRRDQSKTKRLSSDGSNQDKESQHSSNKAINFNLGVWRLSDDLIAIDTRQPNSALPTEKLLLNIVKALGYPLAQLPRLTQLRWPSVEDASSHDEESASAMVEAFLTAEYNKQPFTKMLLMGNNAAKYVLPLKDKNESEKKENVFNFNALVSHSFDIATTEVNAKAIVVPSLTILLQKPKFKAITWQSIQGFRV
ncbi:MAG: hypothetical protein ACRBCS_09300 [Cellvibrionaceae bacterium]